ncbi:MAG: hypothetical protein RBR34_10545 [Rhodospirillaceae bacterium]|nr:hypothetical protein [Rhodospirillaceae bacterium]
MDDTIPQLPRSLAAMDRLERALKRLEQAVAGDHGDLFGVSARRQGKADDARTEQMEQSITLVEQRLDAVIERLSRRLTD